MTAPMTVLGIDTSNYATSLSVVNAAGKEVVYAKKRLLPVQEGKRGLRQSDAVFHHTAALPEMIEEMRAVGVLRNIGAVGVSAKPRPHEGSYMPCFLAGVSVATAFAAALHMPLFQTSHQEGHVAAALYAAGYPELNTGEMLALHVSGGTTELLLTQGYHIEKIIGASLDLYAGQAVDRLGVKLGFAFPAGEQLSALALTCEEEVTPKISVDGTHCHLSGLENQCDRLLAKAEDKAYVAKMCLVAIADTLAAMIQNARQAYPGLPVLCAGGVMSSEVIKARMQQRLESLFFVPPEYAGDNAIGVALIAVKEAGHG